MQVSELWRYPVKSMGGERLDSAELGALGIPGDRVVHAVNRRGKVVTSRSRPRLLTHRATLGADGEPLVDGRPWSAADVARDVELAAGEGSHLVRFEGSERFDVLPLLVATDGALAAFGYDSRRLRPNIIVSGVEVLAERTWEGSELHIGESVIGVVSLRQRCIMTTFDPDTAEQDTAVLEKIWRDFDGHIALDCEVRSPGIIHVGDPVELIPMSEAKGNES